jgi:hypothetical protein
MEQEDWQDAIDNPATYYELKDVAVALLGDPNGLASDSQPYMLIRCRHKETMLSMQFTFQVPKEVIPVLGTVFNVMHSDMERNVPLSDTNRFDIEDDDE